MPWSKARRIAALERRLGPRSSGGAMKIALQVLSAQAQDSWPDNRQPTLLPFQCRGRRAKSCCPPRLSIPLATSECARKYRFHDMECTSGLLQLYLSLQEVQR